MKSIDNRVNWGHCELAVIDEPQNFCNNNACKDTEIHCQTLMSSGTEVKTI